MKALVLGPGGQLRLASRAMPEVLENEALVQVLLAGLCSTDLQLRQGYMDFEGVLGHEFVGRIQAADAAPERVGQLVAGEINAACGACESCAAGLGRHCPDRTVLGILGRDGAFGEYLSLPLANLHPLPAELPLERAVFVEPLAAAFEITRQLPDLEGQRTLVMGAGKLGGLCAQVLRLAGAQVSITARNPQSLTLLVADGFETRVSGRYDLVVEATGSPDGFPAALQHVRPCGTVLLKSTCAGSQPLNLAPVVIDEITVVGSRCGPFEPAIAALVSGQLQPERTIGGRFPLAQFEAAFAAAASPEDPARRKILLELAG